MRTMTRSERFTRPGLIVFSIVAVLVSSRGGEARSPGNASGNPAGQENRRTESAWEDPAGIRKAAVAASGRIDRICELAVIPEGWTMDELLVDGDFLYVLLHWGGGWTRRCQLNAYDLRSTPDAPTALGSFEFPYDFYPEGGLGILARNQLVYCLSRLSRSWAVVDYRDPSKPVLSARGHFEDDFDPAGFKFWRGQLLTAPEWLGSEPVLVFDLTDPAHPAVSDTLPLQASNLWSLHLSDSGLCYELWQGELLDHLHTSRIQADGSMLFVSDLQLPHGSVNHYFPFIIQDGFAYWIGMPGSSADSAEAPYRLFIADVRDPVHPELKGTKEVRAGEIRMTLHQGFLVAGSEIFDVRDPDHPALSASYGGMRYYETVHWPFVYTSDSWGPVMVLRYDSTAWNPDDSDFFTASGILEMSRPFPNPFNGSVSVYYGLDAGAKTSVEIYNVLGQRIRREDLGDRTAGSHVYRWDGCDEGGQPAAAGVYILKLKAGRADVRLKMLKLN
jgi:hypothetical protein